jgi:hypothetical protein
MQARWFVALLVVGCTGEGTPDDAPVFVEGTISVEGQGASGDVAGRKAFAYAVAGRGVVYIASNGLATCEDTVEYLSARGAFDPSATLMLPGHCNISFAFNYDAEAGFEGAAYDYSSRLDGLTNLGCAMGEGVWVYESRQEESDYYYNGRWWQGSPTDYDVVVHGEGTSLSLELDLRTYSGGFIYEGLENFVANGSVTGTIDAEWCENLRNTPIF